jgi:hypothetical protein
VVLDTVVESIHRRYAANAVLCVDVSCMNPNTFPEIREKSLPKTAMKELRKCLLLFDEHATIEALQAELISTTGDKTETVSIGGVQHNR